MYVLVFLCSLNHVGVLIGGNRKLFFSVLYPLVRRKRRTWYLPIDAIEVEGGGSEQEEGRRGFLNSLSFPGGHVKWEHSRLFVS